MRKINRDALIWCVTLEAFSVFLIYLLASRKIYLYINPEMVKYTIFAILGCEVLSIFQFKKIFESDNQEKIKFGYLIFLILIILGMVSEGFDTSIAYKKNISVAESKVSESKSPEEKKELSGKVTVRFNDKNYYSLLKDIGQNLDKYVDKKIEIIGFVYKDGNFGKNKFVIARMLMTCCAADSQVVGIMCEYPKEAKLEKGRWLRLEGIIEAKDYKDSKGIVKRGMAIIKVKKIREVSKPINEYIYS